MSGLTHFDESGASRMVDTSGKPETLRTARASALVRMRPETLALVRDRGLAKGDVREVARLAGIMAAKRTGDLIPLCHPLPVQAVTVDFTEDVLDGAQPRRHARTVNAAWGNQTSILLGDLLFARALLLTAQVDLEACRVIGAATDKVCAGELLQISRRGDLDLD